MTGKTLQRKGKDFSERTPVAQKIIARTDKQDCMTFQSFWTSKETFGRVDQQSTEWEKIFANCSSDKGLVYRLHKNLES